MRLAAVALLAVVTVACSPGAPPPGDAFPAEGRALFTDLASVVRLPEHPVRGASSEFWEWWGDGHGELSGYRLTLDRYGEPREAELAMIYVTEPHDRRSWIKDDDVRSPDRVEVLKLNVNVSFLAGIYPYAVMTSVFAPVDRFRDEGFQPVRIVHSAQEWCGAYSHRVWPGPDRLRSLRLSYFAGEDERIAEVPVDRTTLYEDALFIQLRELDGAFAGGGDWNGTLVPRLWRVRAGHGDPAPVPARITRGEGVRETPDGPVPVTRFRIEAGDYASTVDVEREWPRRILGWTTSTGEEAELQGSVRLPYWELNRLGDESHREALGLSPLGIVPPGASDAPPTRSDDREGPAC